MSRIRPILAILAVLSLTWTATASTAQQVNALGQPIPQAAPQTAPGLAPVSPSAVAAVQNNPNYRLGPGDKLHITTYGEPTLSGDFFVGGAGTVSFPLIGDVAAQSMTVADFRSKVETGLRDGYIKDPRVTVEVMTYRPYYVLGEVGRPGEYPYINELTVMNAVATASGFSYRANKKKVFIRHAGETAEREYPLTSTTVVAPGDTIRITERYF